MQKLTLRRVLPKPKSFILPAIALRRVTSRTGKGVYASSDVMFKGAVFGRDSIEVAEDILTFRPKLAKQIILTLASLQGEIDNDITEEQPGKIIHEYRTAFVDGKPLEDIPRLIFEELSARWGGDGETLAYYGSIDATPHFIRLVHRYCQRYGRSIMQERIQLRSGHVLSMEIVIENAVEWLLAQIERSPSGLVQYQRLNPVGLANQVWKDSDEFYTHDDGTRANHDAPIASIEVQGLAYDALLGAADLLSIRRDTLLEQARVLREGTIWQLWDPQHHYFALGTDFDASNELRVIRTITANPAALLDTHFFDGLPDTHRQEYIGGIVKAIMGRDFLTDAGIRSRALSAARIIPFWDYHGSFVTWPKETYDIAKGLQRQGFPLLARELENRLLNIVLRNWEYPEFVYVDEWGRVLAISPSAHEHGDFTLVDSTNTPERIQAWTVSAILAIVTERFNKKLKNAKPELQELWQIKLEKQILSHIPRVQRLINPIALRARYPTYRYKLVKNASKKSSNFLNDKIEKKK